MAIQIPEQSAFVGKQYEFEEDFQTESNISFCKGMKFTISKLDGSSVTIKFDKKKPETAFRAVKAFADIIAKNDRKDEKTLASIVKKWDDEKEKFKPIPNHFWNRKDESNDNRGGHCINTSYIVPANHPDKYGMAKSSPDTIMTLDYMHIDGDKNKYSYQSGNNEWYSRDCYYYMMLSQKWSAEKYEKLSTATQKELFQQITKPYTTTIRKFNTAKFKKV